MIILRVILGGKKIFYMFKYTEICIELNCTSYELLICWYEFFF